MITALIVLLLVPTACPSGEAHIPMPDVGQQAPVPIGGEAYDDITGTPGGVDYLINVVPTGPEGYWALIQSTSVTMSSWFSEINVSYRHYIETGAGETRNNIFKPSREGKDLNEGEVELYATSIPPGMTLTQYMAGGGIRPPLVAVLVIEIAPDVAPGQYGFEIGLELNGWDYGTVPCTIEVVGE